MSISATLSQLLNKNDIPYKIYNHPRMNNVLDAANWHKLDLNKVIDSKVLVAQGYHVLVVYPATHCLDLTYLNQKLNKKFSILEPRATNRIFRDCEIGLTIPFGDPYKLDIIIDKNIDNMAGIYFNGGGQASLVEISLNDFLFLNLGGLRLNCAQKVDVITDNLTQSIHKISIEGHDLPAIPKIIQKIIELSQFKDTTFSDLAQLVAQENDALLNEILGDLNPNLLKTSSESSAVLPKFRHLSHVVIGVSTGKALAFKTIEGVDLQSFWMHAFMAGMLAEELTKHTNLELDPKISYFAGVFHNIGFLLLAKLFPPEFKLLQKWQAMNPEIPIQILEQKLLGMGKALNIIKGGHAELGEILLRSWDVSEEICIISGQHHNLHYTGKYANYVSILQIANYLLRCHEIGDGSLVLFPEIIKSLGLTQENLDQCLNVVLAAVQDIEKLTKAITK